MNKKYFLAFLFVSGLIVSVFLRKPSSQNSEDGKAEKIENTARRNINPNKYINDEASQPNAATTAVEEKRRLNRIDRELEEEEQRFLRIEKLWEEVIRSQFKGLGLSDSQLEDYQVMREEFEQEALAEMETFHQKMQEARGKNYTYRLTEFDDKVMNKLRKEYNERLAEKIGEEAVRDIVATRDRFNERLKRENKNSYEDILIDF